ncbi:hypothetical protein HAX54_051793 [Datura stramonium]|uniref:Uncharacterized protein n=1 Tax=Datura stramonium TaxID=4076 RepID=A0ABS8RRW8_DATST|nr:hypothetical protein [Datura stramonium]
MTTHLALKRLPSSMCLSHDTGFEADSGRLVQDAKLIVDILNIHYEDAPTVRWLAFGESPCRLPDRSSIPSDVSRSTTDKAASVFEITMMGDREPSCRLVARSVRPNVISRFSPLF